MLNSVRLSWVTDVPLCCKLTKWNAVREWLRNDTNIYIWGWGNLRRRIYVYTRFNAAPNKSLQLSTWNLSLISCKQSYINFSFWMKMCALISCANFFMRLVYTTRHSPSGWVQFCWNTVQLISQFALSLRTLCKAPHLSHFSPLLLHMKWYPCCQTGGSAYLQRRGAPCLLVIDRLCAWRCLQSPPKTNKSLQGVCVLSSSVCFSNEAPARSWWIGPDQTVVETYPCHVHSE